MPSPTISPSTGSSFSSIVPSTRTVYVNESSPKKSVFGAYVTVPSSFTVTVPFAGSPEITTVDGSRGALSIVIGVNVRKTHQTESPW